MKLLEHMEKKFPEIGLGNDFMAMTTKVQTTKNTNRQIGLYEAKKLLHGKGDNRQRGQATEWAEILSGVLRRHSSSQACKYCFLTVINASKTVTYLHVFELWNRE